MKKRYIALLGFAVVMLSSVRLYQTKNVVEKVVDQPKNSNPLTFIELDQYGYINSKVNSIGLDRSDKKISFFTNVDITSFKVGYFIRYKRNNHRLEAINPSKSYLSENDHRDYQQINRTINTLINSQEIRKHNGLSTKSTSVYKVPKNKIVITNEYSQYFYPEYIIVKN